MPATDVIEHPRPTVASCKLPSDVVAIIDAVASFHLQSRSTWVRAAILDKLKNDRVMDRYEEYGLQDIPA